MRKKASRLSDENFKADAICSYDSLMAEWPLAFLKLHILRNRYLLSWSFIEQTNKQIESNSHFHKTLPLKRLNRLSWRTYAIKSKRHIRNFRIFAKGHLDLYVSYRKSLYTYDHMFESKRYRLLLNITGVFRFNWWKKMLQSFNLARETQVFLLLSSRLCWYISFIIEGQLGEAVVQVSVSSVCHVGKYFFPTVPRSNQVMVAANRK